VFTIATNKVRDYWGSRTFQDRLTANGGDAGEDAELSPRRERKDKQRGPRETLAGAELGAAVAAAVDRLPDALRQTLVLRYFEGLSFAEIARVVERNEVAVRKRYSRAIEELRALLGELHADGEAEGGVG
jgi:RNA polymerase sigma-70 factor (ECF subfamily)